MRTTHTFVTMELSQAAFDEIKTKLEVAGYDHAIQKHHRNFTILLDMTGIGLVVKTQ